MILIVVCREDRKPGGDPGDYSLATRRVFYTLESAETFAASISQSREPLIIASDFRNLRFVN